MTTPAADPIQAPPSPFLRGAGRATRSRRDTQPPSTPVSLHEAGVDRVWWDSVPPQIGLMLARARPPRTLVAAARRRYHMASATIRNGM